MGRGRRALLSISTSKKLSARLHALNTAYEAHLPALDQNFSTGLRMALGTSAPTSFFKYVKAERISLATHPQLTEKWVQDRIAEDPSILGLGDLELRDKERPQPRA